MVSYLISDKTTVGQLIKEMDTDNIKSRVFTVELFERKIKIVKIK